MQQSRFQTKTLVAYNAKFFKFILIVHKMNWNGLGELKRLYLYLSFWDKKTPFLGLRTSIRALSGG
jgi:hypothetical protein